MDNRINRIISFIVLGMLICGCANNHKGPLYDQAQVIDIMNVRMDTKIGEMSLIEVDSSAVDHDDIEDWYFNFILVNDFDWCIILYTDSDESKGIYGIKSFVEVNVFFSEENDGTFIVDDSSESTLLIPQDGILK